MIFPVEFSFLVTIIAFVIIIALTYHGYQQGFVLKAAELLSTIISIVIAWYLSRHFSNQIMLFPKDYSLFNETILDSPIYWILNRMLLFVVFLIALGLLFALLRPLLKGLNNIPLFGGANRLMGSVLGFLHGFVILVVIAFVLSSPLFANGDVVLKESHLSVVKEVYRQLLFVYDDNFSRMESIQKIVTPSTQLMDEDVKNIREWLVNQGFNETEQEEVMKLIVIRDGYGS